MKIDFGRAAAAVAAVLCIGVANPAEASFIAGSVFNTSTWADDNPLLSPPGDGDSTGTIRAGIWNSDGDVSGSPAFSAVLASGSMPFGPGPYAYNLGTNLADATYTVLAWVDANNNGRYDVGEPRNQRKNVTIEDGTAVVGVSVTILDDSDDDGLPDWWEAHWFRFAEDPLGRDGGQDSDNDGLINLKEYTISIALPVMELMNPANWDTDGDGMDDKWEYDHYYQAGGFGLNPTISNRVEDIDGDGLSSWQEYCGVDGDPVMVFSAYSDGVRIGQHYKELADDLNPLDIDTDFDLLIDSFEAAWYDPKDRIDPKVGLLDEAPRGGDDYDTEIARADPDRDGLTNYREQCLLAEFREGAVNGDKWVWEDRLPFPQLVYFTDEEEPREIRVVLMSSSGANLDLGLTMDLPIPASVNRAALRDEEWTDPTNGTGYMYTDEDIPAGYDTDDDFLPDGWEVTFNLDPRDDGMNPLDPWTHGPFGDPDGDGLNNWNEYLGQDGERFTTKPYVNGTGDETNPNEYNWRPDSTYEWRWFPDEAPHSHLTDSRVGTGLSRVETLGSALPTISLGVDIGTDSDDDGIPDVDEIHPASGRATSPVHSTDPYRTMCVAITNSAGIPLPDPEPALWDRFRPAGIREDLQRRDWTIECHVKLRDENMTGDLFHFVTSLGPVSHVVYRLSLEQNVPVLRAQNSDGALYTLTGKTLPTNEWIHLAGVWNHEDNNLSLFIHGVLSQGVAVKGESASALLFAATNQLALAASPDGSFVGNLLLDEVRIWGIARTARQIDRFSREIVPQGVGDDVWLNGGSDRFYDTQDTLLVNGGSLFEGQEGIPLADVYTDGTNYWIDNGNGLYDQINDVLLVHKWQTLDEGAPGEPVDNVLYNDKDGSGDFSRQSLLAYYRFDDGGNSAEDFARKARNGLVGATSESYLFGDRGYALTTGFSWVTNDAAPLYSADARGADDSDGDGMPDAWEMVVGLNPWDDGAGEESAPGAKDGPYGAIGDLDGDGLQNRYEFWAETNPRERDSDGDSLPDSLEDFDGDGIANITEQELGSRPDLIDTDDDGISDRMERDNGTNPSDPTDPAVSRALRFDGAADTFVEAPRSLDQALSDWTLEAWIAPDDVSDGLVMERHVEVLGTGSNALNYVLGVKAVGPDLVPYAGYRTLDGQDFMVQGGVLPTGAWTHVAASYNSITATLAIYTNGAWVAGGSGYYAAPPVNGKGGTTALRFGQGFAGRLDDIRLWSAARSEALIRTNFNAVLTELPSTLVHYFRFDDGQATTNEFPFGPMHQPAGAQDFRFEADWNAHWRHAATLVGGATFVEPGAIVPPSALKVVLQPSEARAAGAAFSVNGGGWRNSGETLYGLAEGEDHRVLFRSISNWTEPSALTSVRVTNGALTTVEANYLLNGALQVSIEPPSAVADGARWRVDSGAWNESDGVVGNLSPGLHVVEFEPVEGWVTPASESASVAGGETNSLIRSYALGSGSLIVNLSPAEAVSDGAQWAADGGVFRSSGEAVVLSAGSHSVLYTDLIGWVPPTNETVMIAHGTTTTLSRVYVQSTGEDIDGDGLDDAWEVAWFGDLSAEPDEDPDRDGMTNLEEFQARLVAPEFSALNPLHYDSDGDGMDDRWEFERYESGAGLNPVVHDAGGDLDGDGLLNLHEYLGMDGKGRLEQDPARAPGVARAASDDALDPLHPDTDGDGLIDSYETAWYSPAAGIDPLTGGGDGEAFIGLDADLDGLTHFREQCLLAEFRQGAVHDLWSEGVEALRNLIETDGAFSPPLALGSAPGMTMAEVRAALRDHEWTSPVNPDTDGDLLPDGWEVEFNLSPTDPTGDHGFWGDPDGDGLLNAEEYRGQDGNRIDFIAGTGDETNPNEHNWRPDSAAGSTGTRRPAVSDDFWYIDSNGSRPTNGTPGGALPTLSLGADTGADTDDDGLPDAEEIRMEYNAMGAPPSPVHSMSPFIPRAASVTGTNGIVLPDPEGSAARGYRPLLHARNWTLEISVYLEGTNLTGNLIHIPGPMPGDVAAALTLSNNVPRVLFDTLGGFQYEVRGPALPANRWIHLAGTWDQAANSLALYIDGVFLQAQRVTEEGVAGRFFTSVEPPRLAASADGSFGGRLWIDEVRIWTLARSAGQVEAGRRHLVPPDSEGLQAYFRFDDGGKTAEDFARRAVSSLLHSNELMYAFGDFGYALPTNGFSFTTNRVAEFFGVDRRGADDSDGDGLPDPWEVVNNLDPFSTNGVDGAGGDADGDGLNNLYEFWSDTNPRDADTDQDGVLDSGEDRDGDGVGNLIEQQLMSRPDMVDTDDDGWTDAEELAMGTNPADPTDPAVSRSMLFSGDDFLTVPTSFRQRITDWTIEAWVYPTNASAAGQTVLRRTVQQIPGGEAMNYVLALEPLGAGTARVSAGYTLTDGTDVRIRGGEVPVNDWTHVAVAYNSLNASLSLYTNGGPAAVSNGLFRAPPINGKGGDTYVRIGENFQGNIDEVRLWNDPRDADEVRDDFLRYLDGDEVGLVHYIRFDDGEANENQIAFSEFHQPRGAQDFAYPEDWNDQWIHALLASGNPLFSTNGALTPPPSLRVVLLPQDAVNRGAQWSLNNGAWRDGGETIRNLDRFDLTHTIQYRSIPGYTAPTNETVTVSNGVTTVLTRTYLENGTLTVTVEPPEAIEAAFAIFKTRFLWNIGTFAQGEYEEREDQIWYLSGTTLTNVPIGGYTVRFAEIIGWNTPASIPVDVTEGLDAYVNGEYSAIEGQIQVTLEPRNAREEGARWRVDGGAWQESGTASVPLDYGEHTVEFLDLASWIEPGPQVIKIKENGVQNLSYTLQEVTGLYVQILPPAAEGAGARWGLVGGAITNRSGVLSLPEGAYAIRFTDLAGWISPEDANVAVTNGFMTRLTRYYYQVEELGAYGTNAPGALFHPRGMEFHSDRVLYIADTDNHRIQRYDALNGVWLTPWGGPGVGAGEFDQPVDVDLDAAGNLYVADLGNNRVQRRSPAGAWTVWGGTDPGTDPGEFWGPFGVAVDAADNLYVAEHYNRRIQRRTPAGAWSEILSNGVADSQVRRPRSLVAEAGGTLLITDFRETTPENALIRRVDSTGGLLATLLESPDGAGGIRKVGNLALEGGDALYAADMYGDVVRRLDFGAGEWSTLVDAGILDGPEGLAWDGLGNLYIADTGNHRVLKLLVAAGYVAQPAPLLAPLAGGGVSLGWPSQENVYYDIEYTEDLMNATGWQPLPGCQSLQATNGWIQCIDTNANFGQRFYRIQAY